MIDTGEDGLGGWTIHIFGPGASHATTVTDTNGDYSFSGLAPGNYVVCEEIGNQPNWAQTFPVSGSGDCTAQSAPPAVLADEGHAVTTTSNGSFGDRDFANAPESTITVTFNPLADLPLPGGGDATEATDITCTDADGNEIGTTDTNTVTTDEVLTSASVVTCTVEFVDP